jgi:hypothetical protein
MDGEGTDADAALSVAVVSDVLYAIGGKPADPPGAVYHSTEACDPRSNSWAESVPLPTYRFFACDGAIGELVYVAGGERPVGPSFNQVLGTLEAYDPATGTWNAKASMPVPVRGAACGVMAGKLYVVGGSRTDYTDTLQSLVQIYDPQTDTWEMGPATPTPRFFAAAGVVEDTLYVVGSDPALSVNEAFSPFEMVKIDVKPGDANNVINLKSGGIVPVAILGSATFDPVTVEPSTVTFAGAHVATRGRGVPMTAAADVNHDGYPDLILYFRTQDLTALTSPSAEHSSAQQQTGDGETPPLQPAGLKPGATSPPGQQAEAALYGKTYSGTPIRGSDTVRIVPPPKPAASAGRLGPRHGLLRPDFR